MLSSANEYFQVTGLFYSPNHLALFLAIGILSSIELFKKKLRLIKVLLFISLLILIYGLYLSECRGAYIALILAILINILVFNNWNNYLSFYKKTFFIIFILGSLSLLIWNTSSTKSESTSGRLFTIEQSLAQLAKKPFKGYGFDSFALQYNLSKSDYFAIERSWEKIRNASYIYNANNDFLELGFEFGMIWIIVFCIFVVMLFFKSKNSYTTKGLSSILICIITFAFTNTILPIPLLRF